MLSEEEKEKKQIEYKERKKQIIDEDLELKGISSAKIKYPLTKILLRLITLFNQEKIKWISESNIEVPKGKSIIFANTHRFKPDFEKITIGTKQPSFIVASDYKNSIGTISGWYLGTRPVIYVDPYSKEDKHYSYLLMKKYLESGLNCTIFPEAVWNLSPNRIVLDTFYGTVKLALETNSVIICTGIERYGKEYIINRSNYLDLNEIVENNYGINYKELSNDKKTHIDKKREIVDEMNCLLRETMATLLYEIWEYYHSKNGICQRKDIPNDYWEKFVDFLVSEWDGYKMSDNVEQQFQNPGYVLQQQVENDLKRLKKVL